jgi:aminoglycoside 2'-N-acetyltransferase I
VGSLRLRLLTTPELTDEEARAVRALMDSAFGTGEDAFAHDDWEHALGGVHALLTDGRDVVAHASVVERRLEIGGRPFRTGYVEAVATAPGLQGRGHGSRVMEAIDDHIGASFQLGALGTGRHAFYERLGWETWRGPMFVRTPGGLERTPDEEGYLLVLRVPASPPLDSTEPISCEWRAGDVW